VASGSLGSGRRATYGLAVRRARQGAKRDAAAQDAAMVGAAEMAAGNGAARLGWVWQWWWR
jgi:hypothetical protein